MRGNILHLKKSPYIIYKKGPYLIDYYTYRTAWELKYLQILCTSNTISTENIVQKLYAKSIKLEVLELKMLQTGIQTTLTCPYKISRIQNNSKVCDFNVGIIWHIYFHLLPFGPFLGSISIAVPFFPFFAPFLWPFSFLDLAISSVVSRCLLSDLCISFSMS